MSSKNKRSQSRKYTENDVLEAVASVESGALTYRDASSKYGIPISSLCDRLKKRVPLTPSKGGPITYLSPDQEQRLLDWAMSMAEIGYGVSRQYIPSVVKDLLDKAENAGYVIPPERKFANNTPSKNWVARFIARHPEISLRKPENLGFQRTHITEDRIREWFKKLEDFLIKEHGLVAAEFLTLENGARIFNLDESGMPLQGTNHRLSVMAPKGSKNVYRITSDTKEQVTVLACVSADGNFENPLVVFPGKRTPNYNFGNIDPSNYSLGFSANGWMDAHVFFTWLSSVFYPAVKDKLRFPILVFLDGHTSHINISIADFCRERDIILFCFPAHASHVLQPLDVSVFGPLKKKWNKAIDNFRLIHRVSITRSHFFHVFDPSWQGTVALNGNVISGFRACGLVPFNVENVKFNKLIDKNAQRKFEEKQARATSGSQTNAYERLGAIKLFQLFESKLTPDMETSFQKRLEENYDLEDKTPKGILWSFYKEAKSFIGKMDNSMDDQLLRRELMNCNDSIAVDVEEIPVAFNTTEKTFANEVNKSSGNDGAGSSSEITPANFVGQAGPSGSNEADELPTMNPNNSAQHVTESSLDTRNDEAGPSRLLPSPNADAPSYDLFEFSPFKAYLKISDHIMIGKKSTSLKPKTPPSFTGKDYHEYLRKTQREKEKILEEKERKKTEREAKKVLKEKTRIEKENQKGKKRARTESDDDDDVNDDEGEITFIESDSNVEEEFENNCAACLGDDALGDNARWIGCNRCPRWYHKGCLSEEVEQMNDDQLKEFNFICNICTKILKGIENRKKRRVVRKL